jgi:DNA-binding phage protein
MATLLDNITETHDGPEPRVLTTDVQAVLRNTIRPGDDDTGEAVASIAEKAEVSTRTVYRVLNPAEAKPTISLDLADRLCLAAGVHIAFACSLVWPDGTVTPYTGYEWDGQKVVPSDPVTP